MGLDEGYVGISQNPKERWASHKRGKSNYPVQKAITKYSTLLKYDIIACFDTLEEALWLEYTLRPLPRLGWNIAVGGGLPPDSAGENNPNFGKQASQETKEKQSKARLGRFCGSNHPRAVLVNIYNFATDKLIAEGVVARSWANENGYHQAHLTATARGKLKQHKGVYARYS
jgi:predicted GIY-YIG superfamily endonuclease